MKRLNWIWLAGALLAIPGAFAVFAFVDATFELGVLHSTWQSAVAIFGSVSLGLYLLWQVEFRARWQRTISMLGYAPIMFALVAWLGVAIQFAFDDCMSAMKTVLSIDRSSGRIVDKEASLVFDPDAGQRSAALRPNAVRSLFEATAEDGVKRSVSYVESGGGYLSCSGYGHHWLCSPTNCCTRPR